MTRRTVHWTAQKLRGPDLLRKLPAIVPEQLDGRAPITTKVMTLGIFAEGGHPFNWHAAAVQIAESHPARILVLHPAPDTESADYLDVEVHAEIEDERGPGMAPLLFSECIAMTLYGHLATYWIDWVQPLIRSDLPSFLWWTTGPPDERFRWDLLRTSFDSLIIDSGVHSLSIWLPAISQAMSHQIGLLDLDWTRGSAFRQLLADAFDHAGAREILLKPDRIQITSPAPDVWPLPASWLWLSWKLNWGLGLPPFAESGIPVEHTQGPDTTWEIFHKSESLVLTEETDMWSLRLVRANRVVHDWTLPRWHSGLAGEVGRLLTDGLDHLYMETLQHMLTERIQPL